MLVRSVSFLAFAKRGWVQVAENG